MLLTSLVLYVLEPLLLFIRRRSLPPGPDALFRPAAHGLPPSQGHIDCALLENRLSWVHIHQDLHPCLRNKVRGRYAIGVFTSIHVVLLMPAKKETDNERGNRKLEVLVHIMMPRLSCPGTPRPVEDHMSPTLTFSANILYQYLSLFSSRF